MRMQPPFGARRPTAFALCVIGGSLGIGATLSISLHLSDQTAVGVLFVAVLAMPRVLQWQNRRWLRPFASDPNVLWAGTAIVGRLELVQLSVVPVPDQARTGPLALLVTRTGLALPALDGDTDSSGVIVPAARIAAVSLGKSTVGNRSYPTLQLLVADEEVRLPLLSGSRGLIDALAVSPLAGRVLTLEQFDERHVDALVAAAPYAPEPGGAPDADERLGPYKRFRRPISFAVRLWLPVGALVGGLGGGTGLGIVGDSHHWAAVAVVGWLLALGTIVWLTSYQIVLQRRVRRAELLRIAELQARHA